MKKQLVPVVAVAVAGLFAVAGSAGALAQGGGGAGGGGGSGAGGAAGGGAAGGGGPGGAAAGGGSEPNGPIGNPSQSTDQGVISRPLGSENAERPTDPNKSSEPAVEDTEKGTQKQ